MAVPFTLQWRLCGVIRFLYLCSDVQYIHLYLLCSYMPLNLISTFAYYKKKALLKPAFVLFTFTPLGGDQSLLDLSEMGGW